MIFIFFVVFSTIFATSESKRPNILIIPGFSGVRLEARLNKSSVLHWYCWKMSNWYTIWHEPIAEYTNEDCFYDNIRLIYDPIERQMKNNEGVQIRPYGEFGDTAAVDYLSASFQWKAEYMKTLIDELVLKSGYTRNSDLFAASYDFRNVGDERDMNIYFDKITKFIENKWQINQKRFIFVTHSMGSALAYKFFASKNSLWKDKYIHSWYSISGALGGSYGIFHAHFAAYASYINKDKQPIPIINLVSTSWPSIYFMYPSIATSFSKRIVITTKNVNYTFDQLRDLTIRTDITDISKIFKYIPKNFDKIAPKVKMICSYSIGNQTIYGINYKGSLGDSEYTEIIEDGDGTIPIESLKLCETWSHTNIKPITYEIFNKLGHSNILKSQIFLDRFISYINAQI